MSETAGHAMKRLSAREAAVMALLLAGRPLQEICAQVPISRSTLWRLRGREDFQRRFEAERKQALENAVSSLHDSAIVFAKTLREVCEDPKARGSEKATAARSGLDSLFKARELFSIEERLTKLEAMADGGNK